MRGHSRCLALVVLLGVRGIPDQEPATANAPAPAGGSEEKTLSFLGGKLFLREWRGGDSPVVLLLHGGRFHSGTWKDLGTLDLLIRENCSFVAVDLPGFGKSEAIEDLDQGTFLERLIAELSIAPCVVVAPSMSGSFAFPLVERQHRAQGETQQGGASLVCGFVPIAPVQALDYAKKLKDCALPALVLWGEQDQVFPVEQADALVAVFTKGRKLILAGAGHPCYLDRPADFHRALVEFVRSLAKKKAASEK